MRSPLTAGLLAASLLAGCTATPTATQSVFAAESAYTAAAHTEAVVGPSLTAADLAAMQALDARAYALLTPLRTAAETGGATAVQAQAATDAIAALAAFLATKKGV